MGRFLETPIGPAAGPNTQLAQNIVASYVCGGRMFELKTVQIIDGEDLHVSKPCILAEDVYKRQGPDHRRAVLYAGQTVRDLREVAEPQLLLLKGEGAVVGGDYVNLSALDALPERGLVRLFADGWRADELGRCV